MALYTAMVAPRSAGLLLAKQGRMMVDQPTQGGSEAPARGKRADLRHQRGAAGPLQSLGRRIIREPFTSRPWTELAFYL